ncbi:MAG: dihydroorotase [Rhodospirillaceae bacterium]|nr:dihydroorotase [Rhodospirillaceae bacterium]
MTRILFTNARLLDPAQALDTTGHVLIEDGVILAAGAGDIPSSEASDTIDCKGACLAPGLVDMRVQSADPGTEHLEDLHTLLHAAVSGGISTIVALPDAKPVIDDASMIDSMSLRATRIGGARLRLYGAATRKLHGKAMAELGMMADAGAVGFSNGTQCIMDALVMRRLLAYSAMLDRPFVQHCEDHHLTGAGEMNESETSTRLGLIGAPAEAEAMIIDRDLHLVRMTGARYHVAHISTRAAIDSLRRAKDEGLPVTADTAPPYFLLNEMAVSTYDTAFKLLPPLRSEDDRQAIIAALADGTIDAIASDHVPVDGDAKAQPFGPSQPGASGVDTLLALTLSLVHQGHLTMLRAMEMLSLAPANILDLDGGALIPGVAADLVLFDPDGSFIICGADFASSSRITPFEGMPVQGRVLATWVNGVPAFEA